MGKILTDKGKKDDEGLEESIRNAIVHVDAQKFADSNFSTFECNQFDLPGGLIVYYCDAVTQENFIIHHSIFDIHY